MMWRARGPLMVSMMSGAVLGMACQMPAASPASNLSSQQQVQSMVGHPPDKSIPVVRQVARAPAASAGNGMAPADAFSSCDPLVPENCMYPFPNNFFLRDDPTTATGHRVHLGEDTMPKDLTGQGIDPTHWNQLDGFSPMMPLLAYFDGVSIENLPGHWELSSSLEEDCPTVLLDAETGERLPHFVELNETARERTRKAFMIWPTERLEDDRRYIVAIRGLVKENGETIQPSEAFGALRDGILTDNYDIEGRRDTFEDIFGDLEAAGVSRDDLQLAWDFNTGSRQSITGRLVHMRDDGLARLPADGPDYRVLSVEDEVNENVFRQIKGEFRSPSYMTSSHAGSELVLDADGMPVYQEDVWVPFTVRIPRSLVEQKRAGRIVQYGHGLFGTQGEVESGYLGEVANRYGYVLCATDWQGMSSYDAVPVALMLANDLSNFNILPDRSHQGLLNFMVLMRMMTGKFASDENVTFDGVSVVDPNARSYYGNSQGGILGGAYMAITPDIEYGTLGVPGASYSLLLPRSADFGIYFAILKMRYPEGLDQILMLSIMQLLWDRAEPSGYLHAIERDPLPNTMSHRVLLQHGLGDAQVTWLGAYAMARSIGAGQFDPSVVEGNEELFGMDQESGPVARSMIVGYDFGAPDAPLENIPPETETDTHEKPRRERTAQDQMDAFFRTGIISPFCDGACDPS